MILMEISVLFQNQSKPVANQMFWMKDQPWVGSVQLGLILELPKHHFCPVAMFGRPKTGLDETCNHCHILSSVYSQLLIWPMHPGYWMSCVVSICCTMVAYATMYMSLVVNWVVCIQHVAWHLPLGVFQRHGAYSDKGMPWVASL